MVDGGTNGRFHLPVQPFNKILFRNPHPQPANVTGQRRLIVWHGNVKGSGVAGVKTGRCLKHRRHIRHRSAKHPHLVQRRRIGHHSPARHPPIGRAQPHNVAKRSRLPHATAGVCAKCRIRHAAGHCRRAAAAAPPRHPLQIPRVMSGKIGRRFR